MAKTYVIAPSFSIAPPPRLRHPQDTPKMEPERATVPKATVANGDAIPLGTNTTAANDTSAPTTVIVSPFDPRVELQLGDVLTNPFGSELTALNRKCRMAIEPEDYVPMSREGIFKSQRQALFAGRLGVWASLLAAVGMGPAVNVSVFWEARSDDIIEAAELQTRRFHVTDDYVKKVLLSPKVAEHLAEFPNAELWMVSGMKVVRGAKVNAESSLELGADTGTKEKISHSELKFLKLLRSRAKRTSFEESSDFVLAVQLRHIKLAAGQLKKVTLSTKDATMADGSSAATETDVVGVEYVATDDSVAAAVVKFYNQVHTRKDGDGHNLFTPDLDGDLEDEEDDEEDEDDED